MLAALMSACGPQKCPPGQIWCHGICTHRAACAVDVCPSGQIRCGGVCVPRQACFECWDFNCPSGQACRGGKCEPCTPPTACPAGRHVDDHCACACDADPRECPGSAYWDDQTCDCACDPQQGCGPGHHLDEACKCVCDEPERDCGPNGRWDDSICVCSCDVPGASRCGGAECCDAGCCFEKSAGGSFFGPVCCEFGRGCCPDGTCPNRPDGACSERGDCRPGWIQCFDQWGGCCPENTDCGPFKTCLPIF